MPNIHINHVQGAFTRDQQAEIMKDITDAFVKHGGEGIRKAVQVQIVEVASGLWCWNGEVETIETIERRRAERRATMAEAQPT